MKKIFGLSLRDILAPPRRLRLDADPLQPLLKTKAQSTRSKRSSNKSKASTSDAAVRSLSETGVPERGRTLSRIHGQPLDRSTMESGFHGTEQVAFELEEDDQEADMSQFVDTLQMNRFSAIRRRGALSTVNFDNGA